MSRRPKGVSDALARGYVPSVNFPKVLREMADSFEKNIKDNEFIRMNMRVFYWYSKGEHVEVEESRG